MKQFKSFSLLALLQYLKKMEIRTIFNLIFFKFFYFLGFSALYKEQSIIAWSQPMDIHFLSSWLFFYQFLMAVLLSPLIYILQGQEFKIEKELFFKNSKILI